MTQTKEQLQTEAVARDMQDAENDQRRDEQVQDEWKDREFRRRNNEYLEKVGSQIRKSLKI